jgi:hypothetical protein
LEELAKNGGMLMTCPAHMSHLFQVGAVLLLDRLKTVKKYLARVQPEDREVGDLLRILRAYETVSASMTVRGSWEKVGFSCERRDQSSSLAVNEARIRTILDVREMWERHFPMDGLSARRRNQK